MPCLVVNYIVTGFCFPVSGLFWLLDVIGSFDLLSCLLQLRSRKSQHRILRCKGRPMVVLYEAHARVGPALAFRAYGARLLMVLRREISMGNDFNW